MSTESLYGLNVHQALSTPLMMAPFPHATTGPGCLVPSACLVCSFFDLPLYFSNKIHNCWFVSKIYYDLLIFKFFQAPCSSRPPQIKNGIVRYHDFSHGSKAKCVCNTGYKLKGDSYVYCQYGQWKGPLPVCQIGVNLSAMHELWSKFNFLQFSTFFNIKFQG